MVKRLDMGKGFAVALAFCAAIVFAFAPNADARSGVLDRSFGRGGVAVASLDLGLPRFWSEVRVHAAREASGRVVASANETIVAFRPDGRVDRSFGSGGFLSVSSFAGDAFELADLAVDAQGRIVLVSRSAPSGVAVVRLLPDGTPDLTFGGGDGVALADFGIQLLPPYKIPPEPYYIVSGVAVSDDYRITVSGRVVRAHSSLCDLGGGFVGRLDPEGDIDTTFAGSGVVTYDQEEIGWVDDLVLDAQGAPSFVGKRHICKGPVDYDPTRVMRLEANGDANPEFGHLGQAVIDPFGWKVALDRSNRTLVLTVDGLLRLTPSGSLDRGFGRRGIARIRLPGAGSRIEDLAITENGGVVVAGTQVHRSHRPGPSIAKLRMALVRLGPRGGLDERLGLVKARFGRASNAVGREILLGEGRDAIVAGTVQSKRLRFRQGLALWRFDLGR